MCEFNVVKYHQTPTNRLGLTLVKLQQHNKLSLKHLSKLIYFLVDT